MNRDEQQFIEKVNATLNEQEVSPRVAARLRQARHSAIASRHLQLPGVWLPAVGAAMLVLAIGVTWFSGFSPVPGPALPSLQQAATDFEMLVQGEELDLYADLDFYLWLEQRGDHAG